MVEDLFRLRKMFKARKPIDFIPPNMRVNSSHLDFGCGTQPRNPFGSDNLFTVDLFRTSPETPSHVIEVGDPLPFPENTFTSVSAYDVVEHLSRDSERGNEFIFYMKEFYRVLKPGGVALIIFPAFPHKDAFSDPTHINFITSRTVDYFVGNKTSPFYAGIDTNFVARINRPLRFWRNWVFVENSVCGWSKTDVRRRISLLKRDFFRMVHPQHRIWVLSKDY